MTRVIRASAAVCLIAVASLLAFPSTGSAQVSWHCFQIGEPRSSHVLAVELTCLINEARAFRDLPRLRPNRDLDRTASRYARRLVRDGLWTHRADGSPGSRVARSGYTRGHPRWVVGEVLGTTDGWHAVWAFFDLFRSPAHRRVLMRRAWRDIGVGAARGQPDGGLGFTLAVNVGRRTARR